MRYVAAYLLSKLSGTESPSTKDLKDIVEAADADFDEEKAQAVVNRLSGKDIKQLIEAGKAKISSVVTAAVPAAQAAEVAEAKPEQQAAAAAKEEESEEDGGFAGMFD